MDNKKYNENENMHIRNMLFHHIKSHYFNKKQILSVHL